MVDHTEESKISNILIKNCQIKATTTHYRSKLHKNPAKNYQRKKKGLMLKHVEI